MKNTTVCFVARTDFEARPGGDTVQWRMYDRAAREAGLRTTTWFEDSPAPAADVFHAFNVDRPLEIYPKLIRVKRRGFPFVLSTIHHPTEWLMKFRRRHPPTGLLGKLLYRSPVGRSLSASETTRELATLLLQGRLAHLRDLRPGWLARVRWLLGNASRIALLTDREAARIEKDFAHAVRPDQAVVVPNWVEGIGAAAAEKPEVFEEIPEPPVIVVGRIEPRKSSLRICRLAEIARRHVVFLGRPLPTERRFVQIFKKTVLSSRYARWIPGVSRSEMGRYYAHSSFLLNASLIEVSPLVDIEALAFGCPVVTTRYALHHDLLPPHTPVCEPYDDESILEWLRWRPSRLQPRQLVDRERCAAQLVQAYLNLARAEESPG